MIIYVYTRIYTCMTIMPRLSGMFLLGEHDGVHKQEFWSSLTYCKISKDAWMICSTLCRVCMAQLWCSWSICVYRVALGLRTDRSNLVAMMEAMHIYIYIFIYTYFIWIWYIYYTWHYIDSLAILESDSDFHWPKISHARDTHFIIRPVETTLGLLWGIGFFGLSSCYEDPGAAVITECFRWFVRKSNAMLLWSFENFRPLNRDPGCMFFATQWMLWNPAKSLCASKKDKFWFGWYAYILQ